MGGKSGGAPSAVPNRCRCGHFPGDHMVIRPEPEGRAGSFYLVPAGPCARCAGSCPMYTPSF